MNEDHSLSPTLKKVCLKATSLQPILPISPIPVPDEPVPAGVLLLITTKNTPTVILTRRPDHLKVHAGQVCFPGGKKEQKDDSLLDTALREMNEEIGLDKHSVHVFGNVAPHITATGYQITPFIGLCQPPRSYKIDNNEVSELFEVPLQYLLDLNNYRIDTKTLHSNDYAFHAIDYEEQYIWGATAAILRHFAELFLAHKQ